MKLGVKLKLYATQRYLSRWGLSDCIVVNENNIDECIRFIINHLNLK